jgi:starvation-inducible DNA-binding protein
VNNKTSNNSSDQMAKHLAEVLSDSYMLMIKTHRYHWNVTGPLFPQLHILFEQQFTELFGAVDEIAERIRALGVLAPGSTAAFKHHTAVKEAGENPLSADAMIKDLLNSHDQLRTRAEEGRKFADEIDDRASEDLLNGRLAAHDKIMWMLRVQI